MSKLVTGDSQNSRAELLIENFLQPRDHVDESSDKVARISTSAVAADLNADGRLDLVVGTGLPGMIWSSPETQRVLRRMVRPSFREAIHSNLPMRALGLGFLSDYQPADSRDEMRKTARGFEPIGANSIFLNLGDQDGDGIPEWRDATKETGLGGQRHTIGIVVFDVDLDGDLDVFTANSIDEDLFPGGARGISGAANQLYINKLAESGELRFEERGAAFDVDGLYDEQNEMPPYYHLYRVPYLPDVYSFALMRFVQYQPPWLEVGGTKSEPGQISTAAIATDANDDGYPDLWVANDFGYLRLYLNREGKRFEEPDSYARSSAAGDWMTLSAGDFNGDGQEDIFAGNMGGSALNVAATLVPDPEMLFDPVLSVAVIGQQYFGDSYRTTHAIVDGADYSKELSAAVKRSAVMPPDAALPGNVMRHIPGTMPVRFDPDSIDPYEFAWGSTTIDVQNDGKLDIYWIGGLYGRGGGIFPVMGTGPGRLLVNTTESTQKLSFADLTAEYRVFNILELQYDRLSSDNLVYRKSPRQNWRKRATVSSRDMSVWGLRSADNIERVANRDLAQASENGRATVAADLNGDGFADLLVRNMGGYDSRASTAKNLKAIIGAGGERKEVVMPPHDPNFPSPTNFEPGKTRVFINTHGRRSVSSNWVSIELLDDTPNSHNRRAIGAKITVNGSLVRTRRVGGSYLADDQSPLLFGLGEKALRRIEVKWPDKARTVTRYSVDSIVNQSLVVAKTGGIIVQPSAPN